MSLVSCEDVSFAYNGRRISACLNFSLEEGDYLCVLGENGAGKSTLVKGILGLKKPCAGVIRLGLKKREIGYLPQQTVIQKDFPASVGEVVLSGCLNSIGFRPFFSVAERRRAEQSMERLGIAGIAGRCYRDLSGGQQQRVLLARALCAARRLLVLDEPAAGLDPLMTAELYKAICQVNGEQGLAVMMVSHDVRCAVRYAKKILHVSHGQLFFGSKEDYVKTEVGRSFLGLGVRND